MKVIHVISGPRNISTAMMYSFAQRPDTIVLDEPFYGVYLKKTGANHPGKDDVLAALPQQEEGVTEQIEALSDSPVIFLKNMAHHMEVLQHKFPFETIDIFLIRNPYQIIASYAQVIETPVMRDIGLQFQFDLFNRQLENASVPVVIDSSILLQNPSRILEKLCKRIGLPFHPQMLSWPPGPKPYDGVWAKYWYQNVHKSNSFKKQETSSRDLPPNLLGLYEEAREYYEKLLPYVIRP
jgi:hypothetical protein